MKRVLIITYYWPPSGGSGVQRWLKFSKYLPKYGWQPVIYTPENPHFNLKDESLLADVVSEAEIIKYPIWEPYRYYERIFQYGDENSGNIGILPKKDKKSLSRTFVNWVRGTFFIPDPRVFWVKPSVKFLSKYLQDHPVDVIITTGPPHSMHLIGLKLKEKFNISWLADFRDPWSQLDILQEFDLSKSSKSKHEQLERSVLQNATKVLMVNEGGKRELEKVAQRPVEVITNGFDQDDFRSLEKPQQEKFMVSHFGLLNDFRNPEILWEVLEQLCQENPQFDSKLDLRLGGAIAGDIKKQILDYPHLSGKVTFYKYLEHDQVIRTYCDSYVLLLPLNKTSLGKIFMTGKIFEYLAVGKPILAFGLEESDAGQLIKQIGAGEIVSFDDKDKLKEIISSWFRDFPNNPINPLKQEVRKFTRDNLTKELVDLLEEMQEAKS